LWQTQAEIWNSIMVGDVTSPPPPPPPPLFFSSFFHSLKKTQLEEVGGLFPPQSLPWRRPWGVPSEPITDKPKQQVDRQSRAFWLCERRTNNDLSQVRNTCRVIPDVQKWPSAGAPPLDVKTRVIRKWLKIGLDHVDYRYQLKPNVNEQIHRVGSWNNNDRHFIRWNVCARRPKGCQKFWLDYVIKVPVETKCKWTSALNPLWNDNWQMFSPLKWGYQTPLKLGVLVIELDYAV